MTHEIKVKHTGKMGFEASVSGHQIHIDTTAENGGDDSGPGPKKLMLVSLAGCTGLDIVSILNKKRVNFADFAVKAEANLTDTHPQIYDAVTITYSIKVDTQDREKVQQAVDLSFDKYCGVLKMFRGFATVEGVIEFL